MGSYEATGDRDKDVENIRTILNEKGLWKEVSENDAMYGKANSFAEVANDIYRRFLRESPYRGASVAPFVVNAAFSIELYLKTMHHAYGHRIRGHNLQNLFTRLPAEGKDLYLASANAVRPYYMLEPGEDIFSSIAKLSKAFEQWRYLYENDRLSTELQSIRYTMHASQEACCRVRTANITTKGR